MITITIYGSDRYAVGDYSREITKKLANLWEIDPQEIVFLAPEMYIYHQGVEQTSYQGIIHVEAPKRYQVFESRVAKFILDTASTYMIHLSLRFCYFEEHEYQKLHPDYPRFMSDDNSVLTSEEEYDENTEIYEGDIFENFEEKWEEKQKQHHHDDEDCCCGHHHEDGECCHGHHHED